MKKRKDFNELTYEPYEPIDLCACYEPFFYPPQEQLEEWAWLRAQADPFRCTVVRQIGNTIYLVETECDGTERLADKVKRLIFSDTEEVFPND